MLNRKKSIALAVLAAIITICVAFGLMLPNSSAAPNDENDDVVTPSQPVVTIDPTNGDLGDNFELTVSQKIGYLVDSPDEEVEPGEQGILSEYGKFVIEMQLPTESAVFAKADVEAALASAKVERSPVQEFEGDDITSAGAFTYDDVNKKVIFTFDPTKIEDQHTGDLFYRGELVSMTITLPITSSAAELAPYVSTSDPNVFEIPITGSTTIKLKEPASATDVTKTSNATSLFIGAPSPVLSVQKEAKIGESTLPDGSSVNVGAKQGVKVHYTITLNQTIEQAIANNTVLTDTIDDSLIEEGSGAWIDNNSIQVTYDGNPEHPATYTTPTLTFKKLVVNLGNISGTTNPQRVIEYDVIFSRPTTDPNYEAHMQDLLGKTVVNSATATADNFEGVAKSTSLSVPNVIFDNTSLTPSVTSINAGESITYTLKATVKDSEQNPIAYGMTFKNIAFANNVNGATIDTNSFKYKIGDGAEVSVEPTLVSGAYSVDVDSNNAGINGGTEVTLTFKVDTTSDVTAGSSIMMTSAVDADNTSMPTPVSATSAVSVLSPALSVNSSIVTAGGDKPSAGDTVTYKGNVKIVGDAGSIAQDVKLISTIDGDISGATVFSNIKVNGTAIPASDYTISDNGKTLTVKLGDMDYDANKELQYDVIYGQPDSPALNGRNYGFTFSATAKGCTGEAPNTLYSRVQSPEFTLAKTVEPNSYATGGDRLTYKITATQSGTGVAKNTQISDTIATSISTVKIDPNSVVVTSDKTLTPTVTDHSIVLNPGDMAEGETIEITYAVQYGADNDAALKAKDLEPIKNTASISAGNVSGGQSKSIDTDIITPTLKLNAEFKEDVINAGDTNDFALDLSNIVTQIPAKGTAIVCTIDATSLQNGVTFVEGQAHVFKNDVDVTNKLTVKVESDGTLTVSGDENSPLYRLNSDDEIKVTGKISIGKASNDKIRGATITLNASATAVNSVDAFSAESASFNVASAKLSVAKSANSNKVTAGNDVGYTVTIKNVDTDFPESRAKDFVLTDTIDTNAATLGYKIIGNTIKVEKTDAGKTTDVTKNCTISLKGSTSFTVTIPEELAPMPYDVIDPASVVYGDATNKIVHGYTDCKNIPADTALTELTPQQATKLNYEKCELCYHDEVDKSATNKIVVSYKCTTKEINSSTASNTLFNNVTLEADNAKPQTDAASIMLVGKDPDPDNGNGNQNGTWNDNTNGNGNSNANKNSSTKGSSASTADPAKTGENLAFAIAGILIAAGGATALVLIRRKMKK